MPFVHRRSFYGKVGSADQLVQHFHDGNQAMGRYGVTMKTRILTDHMTGRSDRVGVEWELDKLEDMDSSMSQLMADPEAAAYFNAWMEKVNSFIHYAEGENWSVREP